MARQLAAIFLIAGAISIIVLAYDVVLLFFTAIVIAVALRGGAEWLAPRMRLTVPWALTVEILGLLVLAVGIGAIAAPGVAEQSEALADALPKAVGRVTAWLDQFPWGRRLLQQGAAPPTGGTGQIVSRAGRFFSSTLGALANLLVVTVIALYLAYGAGSYVRGSLRLVPAARRDRAAALLAECGAVLRGWLSGQLVAMVFTGITTYVGLLLLGIPFALVLGVLAGLTNIVPYVGPIVSAVPAMLIALTVDARSALYVGLFFLVLQNVEGNLVTPLAQRRAIDMPPAVLIAAQLLLGVLFGFLGVLTAAPLTAVAIVAVRQLYLEEVLGEPPARPAG
jgi:predicted PurR-regulated permease PerM